MLTPVPLANANWTPAENELDVFYGEVTLDLPSQNECGAGHSVSLSLRIDNFTRVLTARLDSDTDLFSGGIRTFELETEPGQRALHNAASEAHELDLLISDSCAGGNHPHLLATKIDVVKIG